MANINNLSALAAEIIAEHAAACCPGADYSKHALAAGQRLIDAKSLVRDGEWLNWLEFNLPTLSVPICERYMRMAQQADSSGSDSPYGSKSLTSERGDERLTPDRCHDSARSVMRGSIEPAVPPWLWFLREEHEQVTLRFINWHLGGDPNEAPMMGPRPLRRGATWENIQLSGLADEITRAYYLCGIHGDLSEDEAYALYSLRVHRDFSRANALSRNGAASPLYLREVEKLCCRQGRGRPKGRRIITYPMLAASDVYRILALWREHYPEESKRTKGLRGLACEYAALRWRIPIESVLNCINRAKGRKLP